MKLKIEGQTLTLTEPVDVAAGSQSWPSVEVTWPDSWTSLHKVVQFTRDGVSYDISMDSSNETHYIPAAVLKTPARTVSVMAYGYNDDGARVTTNALYIDVQESLFSGETGTDDPTPSEYEKLRKELDEMGGDIDEAVETYITTHSIKADAEAMTNQDILDIISK